MSRPLPAAIWYSSTPREARHTPLLRSGLQNRDCRCCWSFLRMNACVSVAVCRHIIPQSTVAHRQSKTCPASSVYRQIQYFDASACELQTESSAMMEMMMRQMKQAQRAYKQAQNVTVLNSIAMGQPSRHVQPLWEGASWVAENQRQVEANPMQVAESQMQVG